jgi:hypothetical protein
MKTCPVVGCDVQIHPSEVLCGSCLASAPRPLRDAYVASWRHFRTHFDVNAREAYERAIRNVVVAAGQAKRPVQSPLDL